MAHRALFLLASLALLSSCAAPPPPPAGVWVTHTGVPTPGMAQHARAPISVTITGAVQKPGRYDYPQGGSLALLIFEAGGFTPFFMKRITIKRQSTGEVLTLAPFNDMAAFALADRIALLDGDAVHCVHEAL